MSVWQIVGGVLLLLSCIIIIVLVMLQESKQNGLSGTISGGSTESYLNQHGHRTREAQLARLTKVAAIAFFVVTIAVNIAAAFLK